MKIKEFAQSRELSNQAIYKAISRAGFSTKQLTDRRGNLNQKGIRILNNLFPDNLHQEPENGSSQGGLDSESGTGERQQRKDEQLNEKITELEKQCSELKTKVEEWEKRYFELQQNKEVEAQEFRRLLLYQFKDAENQKLIAAAEGKRKNSFLKRLFQHKTNS